MQPTIRIARAPESGKERRKVVKVVGPARDTPFPLKIKVNRPSREKPKVSAPNESLQPFERQMKEFASGMANSRNASSPPPNTI